MLTSGAHVREATGRETLAAQPKFERPEDVLAHQGMHVRDADMVDHSDYKDRDKQHLEPEMRRNFKKKQLRGSVYTDGVLVPEPRGRETAQHVPHMYTRDEVEIRLPKDPKKRKQHRKDKKPSGPDLGRKTEPVSAITKAALAYR